MVEMKEWDGFEGRLWKEEINVRQFIQDNYTPYEGNEDFLEEPTEATEKQVRNIGRNHNGRNERMGWL